MPLGSSSICSSKEILSDLGWNKWKSKQQHVIVLEDAPACQISRLTAPSQDASPSFRSGGSNENHDASKFPIDLPNSPSHQAQAPLSDSRHGEM
jgi:hypothetical protein